MACPSEALVPHVSAVTRWQESLNNNINTTSYNKKNRLNHMLRWISHPSQGCLTQIVLCIQYEICVTEMTVWNNEVMSNDLLKFLNKNAASDLLILQTWQTRVGNSMAEATAPFSGQDFKVCTGSWNLLRSSHGLMHSVCLWHDCFWSNAACLHKLAALRIYVGCIHNWYQTMPPSLLSQLYSMPFSSHLYTEWCKQNVCCPQSFPGPSTLHTVSIVWTNS